MAIAIDPGRGTVYAGSRTSPLRTSPLMVRCAQGAECVATVGQGLAGDRVFSLRFFTVLPMRLLAWMHAGGLFRSEDRADTLSTVDSDQALRRSTAQAGMTMLAIDPANPWRVYLRNGSVLQFLNP